MSSAPSPIERQQQLGLWVAQQLGSESITLTPIASDAGFRRYFRFESPSQWLAVDAPPQTEDSRQFVALARYLSGHQVKTPKILAADEGQGFLLVEDFGDKLLHGHLNSNTALHLYREAFKSLLSLQACPDQPDLIPRYDRALLRRELEIFSEWFVAKLLGYELSSPEQAMLDTLFKNLEDVALGQPQTLVHRDFHSRNLIIRSDDSLGVIDFQGALWGGCTYDLVSLLRDCYISWPEELVTGLALEYRAAAINAKVLDESIDEARYLRWFDWLGLQRHIKVLGIFARLNLRDNKPNYLKDLPLVIHYTLSVAESYPQLTEFSEWFRARLMPLIEQQPWFSGRADDEDEQ